MLGRGPAGFPNGRRLTDDVVDIELQALEGAAQNSGGPPAASTRSDGDKVDAQRQRSSATTFPYLALPEPGAVNVPDRQRVRRGAAAAGGGGTPTATWLPGASPASVASC